MKRLFVALAFGVAGALSLLPSAAFAQTNSLGGASTAPKPTCFLAASGNSPNPGATVNLTWHSLYADGGSINTIGSVPPDGTQGVIPLPPSTTYVGTFTGPGGTGTCSITVSVGASQGTGGFPSSGSGGGGTGGPGIGNTGGTLDTSHGLVTCGQGGNAAATCNICTLSSTFQMVLNFALALTIPIAAGMFAYAAWLFFSNRENPTQVNRAKSIFWKVLVGFVLALMSWLMVQTILKVVAPGYTSWTTFNCNQLPPRAGANGNFSDLGQVLGGNLGTPNGVPTTIPSVNIVQNGGGSTNGTTCPDGSAPSITESGNFCVTPNGVVPAGNGPGYVNISNGAFAEYLNNACSTNGMDSNECNVARAISMNESTGGRDCRTSNTGAVGCMQVLSTTACSIDPSIPGCSTCRNSANAGCADVASYISDPQINTNLGTRYIDQLYRQYNGDCRLTAAAYFQGPGNVQKYGGVPPNAVSYVNRACGA